MNDQPTTFADGGVNDFHELYTLQHAITEAGGTLSRPVHRAIDDLRAVWDRELRREQQRRQTAASAGVAPAADQSRQFLTTLADLGIATHRLDRIRDAARLHRQQLIGTSELYAVIEADDEPPAAVPAVDQTAEAPCKTTQHCAHHGWCRRCDPDFAALMSRINVAIQRTDADDSHWGPLYEAIGRELRPTVLPDTSRAAEREGTGEIVIKLFGHTPRRVAGGEQPDNTETACERCGHGKADHNISGCAVCPGGWRADHRFTTSAVPAAPDTEATPVQHAPGKATLCPDCRAKGYAICVDAEPKAAPDTEEGPS